MWPWWWWWYWGHRKAIRFFIQHWVKIGSLGGTVQKSRKEELEAQEVCTLQGLFWMSFADPRTFLALFGTKISGLQRRRVHHGLLLWLVLKSSYMRNPGSIQHFFCCQWRDSQRCGLQSHVRSRKLLHGCFISQQKQCDRWVDLHPCSSMFSCFEGCVARVCFRGSHVLYCHEFSQVHAKVGKELYEAAQGLYTSPTKKTATKAKKAMKAMKWALKCGRWHQLFLIFVLCCIQIRCALEHVTIEKELGGAQVALLELKFHCFV